MPTVRWVLLGLLVLVMLAAASLTAEPGEWHETVERARAYRRTAAARAATCPVLVGEPRVGDARAAYERAAELAGTIDPDVAVAMRALVEGRTVAADFDFAGLHRKLPAGALAALRAAARTQGTAFSVGTLGRRLEALPFGDLHVLVDALLVQFVGDGDLDGRLEAWLDASAFAWDLVGTELPLAEMVGLMVAGRALAACDDEALQSLGAARLRRLATAVAAIDEATPVEVELGARSAHLVLTIAELPELQPHDLGMRSVYQAWRHGFSIERAGIQRVGAALVDIAEFERRSSPSEPWGQRRERLERLVRRDRARCRGSLVSSFEQVLDVEQQRRETLARLRLLRLASAHLLGERLELDDPLGAGELRAAAVVGGVRFSSSVPYIERTVASARPSDDGPR